MENYAATTYAGKLCKNRGNSFGRQFDYTEDRTKLDHLDHLVRIPQIAPFADKPAKIDKFAIPQVVSDIGLVMLKEVAARKDKRVKQWAIEYSYFHS